MTITLTKKEREEYKKLKQTLTISWCGLTPPRIDGSFFGWCQRSHQPYVRVQKYRNHASVFMDLPGSGSLDQEGADQFRRLCASCEFPDQGETLKKAAIDNIPLDLVPLGLVDEFARKLVVIGQDYCRRNPAASQNSWANADSTKAADAYFRLPLK